jgi:hypothetical protein
VLCATCGTIFTAQAHTLTRSGSHSRHCSRRCYELSHRTLERGGAESAARLLADRDYGACWPDRAEEARARDARRCRRCHIEEATLPRRLDVHHIVAFARFGGDLARAHALDNLIALCTPCHHLVEWRPELLIALGISPDVVAAAATNPLPQARARILS